VSAPAIITGTAHGRRATIEIAGDTLTWRARRGLTPVAENIVTTVHDVRLARWIVLRHSWAGLSIAILGGIWIASEGLVGAVAIAVGLALMAWRLTHPRQYLVLDLGQSHLVMRVTLASTEPARILAGRIDRALQTGELPSSPPMLP
jgi:hypothetical protein